MSSRPRINLLPYRQERRAQKQREFTLLAFVAIIVGVVIVLFGNQVLSAQLQNQQNRNALLRTEIAKLDNQIKEIDKIREEIRLAVERKKTVEQLQNNRTVAVHLLDQMIRQLPEGVYLDSATQKGNTVNVVGFAQSNAHVSAFMRNVESSDWIESPKLVESKLVMLDEKNPSVKNNPAMKKAVAAHKTPTQAFQFTMTFRIRSGAAKPKTTTVEQGRA